MLKKSTETTRVEQVPRSRYSPTPEPIHYPVIPPTEEGTEESYADSVEPSVPGQDNSHGLLGSESLIENSDGWDYDYYTGTWEHPIPVYNSDGDGGEEPNPGVGTCTCSGRGDGHRLNIRYRGTYGGSARAGVPRMGGILA